MKNQIFDIYLNEHDPKGGFAIILDGAFFTSRNEGGLAAALCCPELPENEGATKITETHYQVEIEYY